MPHEITIRTEARILTTESFEFPGGEIQLKIPDLPERLEGPIRITARLQSPSALIRLILLREILNRTHSGGMRTLIVPYFPYARQDRVMQSGEAFSLKAIARLINGLGFDRVVTFDPHSDVAAALVDGIEVVDQVEIIKQHRDVGRIIHSGVSIVAPDAGAAKKAFATARYYGLPLLTASKVRDVGTGAITRTELHAEVLPKRNALIVDDICDGGRTFIELAKLLKAAGAEKVYLYVTHGIFSQGLGVFDGLIDGIFTTDSFLSRDVEAPPQTPVPLFVSALNF